MTDEQVHSATVKMLAEAQKRIRELTQQNAQMQHDLNEIVLYLNRSTPNVDAALRIAQRSK